MQRERKKNGLVPQTPGRGGPNVELGKISSPHISKSNNHFSPVILLTEIAHTTLGAVTLFFRGKEKALSGLPSKSCFH